MDSKCYKFVFTFPKELFLYGGVCFIFDRYQYHFLDIGHESCIKQMKLSNTLTLCMSISWQLFSIYSTNEQKHWSFFFFLFLFLFFVFVFVFCLCYCFCFCFFVFFCFVFVFVFVFILFFLFACDFWKRFAKRRFRNCWHRDSQRGILDVWRRQWQFALRVNNWVHFVHRL